MMTSHERIGLAIAVVLSVGLHAAVAVTVRDVQLRATPGSVLFDRQDAEPPPRAVSVRRLDDDVLTRDDADEPDLPDDLDTDDEDIEDLAERMLENLDLSDLIPDEDETTIVDADEAAEQALTPDAPERLDASLPGLARGRALDTTDHLLAAIDPTVSLPEFVDLDDEPAPLDADGGRGTGGEGPGIGDDDLAALDDLLLSDVGDGDRSTRSAGADDDLGLGDDALASLVGDDLPEVGGRGVGDGVRPSTALPGGRVGGGGGGPGLPDITGALVEVPLGGSTVHLDGDFTYRLRVTRDLPRSRGLFDVLGITDEHADDHGWFEVRVAHRQSLRRLDALHKDVIWLIDASGTINPWWVNQAASGVRQSLRTLNEGDRFNIVFFADGVRPLSSDGLLERDDANFDAAREFLARPGVSGGADIHEAIARQLVRDVDDDRVRQIILLSPGRPTRGTINVRNLVNLVTRDNDRVTSIHAVGLGDNPNRELLESLTNRNKGFAVYPSNPQQTAATIVELATRLRYPIVRDATFAASGVDRRRIHPQTPREIYLGEPLSLYGRFTDDAQRVSMRISGTNRDRDLDMTFTLNFRNAFEGDESIAHQWAYWRLQDLYNDARREGDSRQIRQQIESLQDRYNLTGP